MSVSKATAVRRAEQRALRLVQLDLERARGAGDDVGALLGKSSEPVFKAWRQAMQFAIDRVRTIRQELDR